jgi:trehalose 6-phosphate phosphatase
VKNILAKRELNRLEQFVTTNTLLAFNFDGTLAPLSRDPRAAQLRKSTLRLLHQVAQHYPTAVISSRPYADVLARLNGVPVRAVVGNHGLEPSPEAPRYHELVRSWLPRLRESLGEQQGVEIENKLYSIAIHYRRARSKTAAHTAVVAAVQQLGAQARAVPGKLVLHVLPAEAPSKGTALNGLRNRLHVAHAVFVGDDLTDEEVFDTANQVSVGAAGQANGADDGVTPSLLGIRIGRTARSQASHYLSTQADIDQLLKRLLEFVPANDVGPVAHAAT